MRRLTLVACCVVALGTTGCFVLDELDQGQAILDQHSPRGKEKAEPAPEPVAPRPVDDGPGVGERLSEWWRSALEEGPTPSDPNDGIVRCTIRGKLNFTRESDCQARGGTFSKVQLKKESLNELGNPERAE